MAVGVDQARDREGAGAIDDAASSARGSASTSSAVPTATISPAPRRQGLGPGSFRVARPDPADLEDQVGRPVLGQPQGPARELLVRLPSAMAATPLTNRYSTPGAYRVGSSKVAASRKVVGSKTTTSANAPGRITPRSGRRRISAGRPEHDRIACSRVMTSSSRA